MTTTDDTEIPDLEFRDPVCPVCNHECWTDGAGWDCDHCSIRWEMDGTKGENA